MWKSWNPFRRKSKEDEKESNSEDLNPGQGGKENSVSTRLAGSRDGNNSVLANTSFNNLNDCETTSNLPRKPVSRQESLRSRTRMGLKDQLNTTLPTPQSHLARRITRCPDDNPMNKTFSGVHGPLLSSPIVPQIRKALESQTGPGLRGILSKGGKPVGRSASLNYGMSRNTRSTAGQVPWVRLKRRESIGLSDLVTGNTPQSPNTVKLAAPEPRHLPAPPSFKTTPVIVTTEPSRSRVIDTQTVVSALREKRKRFGNSQHDEAGSEDSWQNSAKRRRQDSSQSNASSVSIPPMPDSLPDLMGAPGTSLLHIENLSSQRPSTVPAAADPYPSAPIMTSKPISTASNLGGPGILGASPHVIGLGGADSNSTNPMALPPQHLPVYRYPTYPPHQQQQQHQSSSLLQRQAQYMAGGASSNINNSKSVLRSIQSSLSSSLRARVNSAALQHHGIDLKRIRGNAQDNARRLSFSSEISTGGAGSTAEPVQKAAKQSASPNTGTVNLTASAKKTDLEQNAEKSEALRKEATVSAPTKRKIAEGVMLRKQSMSITPTASPARPLRALPASTLVSADDFESDRQQEYRRRVLDMLGGEEGEADSTGATQTSAAASSTLTLPTAASLSSSGSQAPTNTINASLASLSKLVQSTTPAASASGPAAVVTTTPSVTVAGSAKPSNSLLQLLKSDDSTAEQISGKDSGLTLAGNPLASPSSDQKNTSTLSIVTQSSTSTVSSSSLTTPSTTSAATATAPGLSLVSTTQSGTASGFQVNFGAAFSAASKPSLPSGFSFGATAAAAPTTASSSNSIAAPGSLNSAGLVAASGGQSTGAPALPVAATPSNPLGTITNSAADNSTAPTPQQNQTVGATAPAKPFSFTGATGIPLTATGQTPTDSSRIALTTLGQGFSLNPALSATAAVSTSATSVSSTTSGFNFGMTANVASNSSLTSAPALSSSGFTFGSVSSSVATATTTTAGASGPGPQAVFAFGAAPLSTATPSQTANTLGMFSGANQLATTTSSFRGFGEGAATAPQTSVNSSNSAPSGFGSFTATATTTSQFSSTTTGLLPSPASNLTPAFGSNTSFGQGASGILATTTTTSSSAGSGFGGTVPSAFNFSGGSSNQAESKPFTFGTQATTTTTVAAAPNSAIFGAAPTGLTVFGASATSTAPSGFGAMASTVTGFGGTSTVTTTAAPFGATGFGASSATPTAAPPAFGASSLSVFGATTTSAPASGFGTGGFGFGNTQVTTAASGKTGFGTVASPAFGATTPFSTAASAFGSSMGTSFATPAKPSPFGAMSPTSGGMASTPGQPPAFRLGSGVASGFGNTSTQNTQASTPFVFGSGTQSQPSTGSNQPFVFGGATATSSQVSVFGSNTAATPSANTPFGQPAQNSIFGNSAGGSKPAFGAPSATPAFGSGLASATNNNAVAAPTPAFGSGLASPAFGSAGQQPKPATPAFGATGFGAGAGQSTTFGSQPSTGVASPFGGATGFGNAAKPNPFGAGASAIGQAAPVFNFSGSQQPQQPQASGVFGAKPPETGSVPQAFNFGGVTTGGGIQPQTGAFNFPSPAAGPSAVGFNFAAMAGSAPSFNFGAGGATPTNMFTPQPGTTPRPRAAATRRTGNRRGPRR